MTPGEAMYTAWAANVSDVGIVWLSLTPSVRFAWESAGEEMTGYEGHRDDDRDEIEYWRNKAEGKTDE